MAQTALAVQEIPKNTGAVLASAGADQANGNKFPNDGRTVLEIVNGDGSARTVTVSSVPCSHGRTQDLVQAIPAGGQAVLGPFDGEGFNQKSGADTGWVYVSWSAGTTSAVKVTARRLV